MTLNNQETGELAMKIKFDSNQLGQRDTVKLPTSSCEQPGNNPDHHFAVTGKATPTKFSLKKVGEHQSKGVFHAIASFS